MEKLLWLDGHTSLISAEESYEKTRVEQKGNDDVFILLHEGFEFEWHNNMWMQR